MESRFLKFNAVVSAKPRKTSTWDVQSKVSYCHLGMIMWYAPWRRYCFYPVAGGIFDAECLDDIVAMISGLMAARKVLAKAAQ